MINRTVYFESYSEGQVIMSFVDGDKFPESHRCGSFEEETSIATFDCINHLCEKAVLFLKEK